MVRSSAGKSDRRRFLKATSGLAGIGFLAGCLGGDDEPDPDPDPGTDTEPDTDPDDDTDDMSEFPERDVTVIIPFGPGGGYDSYVRLLAPYLEDHLPGDHAVRVQNVEGAGGAIAAEQVYNADSHTLMIASVTGFSLEQMFRDVGFDLGAMTYYAQVAFEPHMLGVGVDTGLTAWEDFADAMRSDDQPRMYAPSPVNVDVAGPVVVGEIGGAWPSSSVVDNLVIYDGRGEGMQGILAGDVEYMSTAYSSIMDFVVDGNLEPPLIYATDENKPDDVPDETETLTSAGLPDVIEGMIGTRRAFAGPPGVSDSEAEIIRTAFDDAIHDDDFVADMDEAGRPINYLGGAEVGEIAAAAIETWQENQEIIDILMGE